MRLTSHVSSIQTSSRCFSFNRENPLESVSTVPRALSGADSPHIPGRSVHDFYLQYRIATDRLSQAEKRFHGLTHFTLEDGQRRILDEPVNHTVPMHEARAAERHASQAFQVALRAPAAFRPRLLVRAVDLHVRVHACTPSLQTAYIFRIAETLLCSHMFAPRGE